MSNSQNGSFAATIVGVVVMIAVVVLVVFLIGGTKKEAEILIGNDTISITGQYGMVYAMSNIESVELRDEMPGIEKKVNGAGLGDIKKGNYQLMDMNTYRLFIHSETAPFIYIEIAGDNDVFLNYKDSNKTREAFEKLQDALNGI